MTNGAHPAHAPVRFGDFEVDFKAGELRKQGVRVKLQEQPFQVLRVLLEHRGEVVSREELREKIWPADTFVDFDQGLNNAVKRLREVLGDAPKNPQFVETVPRHGYRFIATTEVAVSASANRIESLVVLPLENLSGDPEQDYFADGLTEAIISELAKINGLRVVSRMTAMFYKNVRRPLPDVARELAVDAVIEGTVFRSADRVRILVQLIDGCSDRHLWTETYERNLREILDLYSELALAVATQIRLKARRSAASAVDPQAYEAYLKGRYHWNKRTIQGLTKGIEYFQAAVQKDPTYASAHSGLADSAVVLGFWSFSPPEAGCGRAKKVAQKALELDDSLGQAHAALAWAIQQYDYDLLGAEKEFHRALQLSPLDATVAEWHGTCLLAMCRFDEALAEIQRAMKLDPLAPILSTAASMFCWNARRYEESLDYAQTAIELQPNFPPAVWSRAVTLLLMGQPEAALAQTEELCRQVPGNPLYLALLGQCCARLGNADRANDLLKQLREPSKHRYITPFRWAELLTALGRKDEALDCLDLAFQERAPWMVYLRTIGYFDPLRNEPRFQELIRRIGFPASGACALSEWESL